VTPEALSTQGPQATVGEAAGEGTASSPATGGPGLSDPAAHEQKLNERTGNVDENKEAGSEEVAAAASLGSPVACGGERA
jgi:hypothetical protein